MNTSDFDIEEIFQALGSLSGLTLQIHRDFKPIFVTEDYARLYGFDDIQGFLQLGSILELVPVELRDVARQRYQQVIESGSSEALTLKALRNDKKEVWVKVQDRRILYQGKYAALTILIDVDEEVTLRHAFEASANAEQSARQRLESMQQLLVEQEKQRALNSLLKGVSHQLNTPLGNIKTATSIIADFTKRTLSSLYSRTITLQNLQSGLLETAEAVFLLEKNTEKASTLINNVKLMVSEGNNDANSHFHFESLVKDTMKLIAQNNNELTVNTSIAIDPAIEAYANPIIWLQVLSILSENSLAHGFVDRTHGTITITSEWLSDSLVIRFHDNGHGIAADKRDRVFEAFYSSKMGQMPGLGLAMAYSLVSKQLHGSISLADASEGTTFVITVPKSNYATAADNKGNDLN